MKVRLKRLGILLIMSLSIFACALTAKVTNFCTDLSTTEKIALLEETSEQVPLKLDLIQTPLLKAAMPQISEETDSTILEKEAEALTSTEATIETSEATEVTEPEETQSEIVETSEPVEVEETEVPEETKWDGPVLDAYIGTIQGPSGKETYYDLPMRGVIDIMEDLGYVGDEWYFWIREDGVKMYGKYIMCAANLQLRPKGTIIETSLGTAIVCDTGGFAKHNKYQLDIATDWTNRDGR